MKKTLILAYTAVFLAFLLPFVGILRNPAAPDMPAPEVKRTAEVPASALSADVSEMSAPEADKIHAGSPAPEKIKLLSGEDILELDMQEYLKGVLAAEMPADFAPEALKAQAVAARSYAMYCAKSHRHAEAEVCTDFNCCQAFIDEDRMRENWGDNFEENYKKISSAVAETEGEYLSYAGEPVFAAFHSSSYKKTENCGDIWSPVPYLISVESPESERTVPDFISRLECAPLDFRDTLLSAFPQADFTGEEQDWIGELERDESGRVSYAKLGGIKIKGTELRELFSLRSAAFELQYEDGHFIFTVRGFGHGVGMSQYGAKLMAENGADYAAILAHYYPGTVLTS